VAGFTSADPKKGFWGQAHVLAPPSSVLALLFPSSSFQRAWASTKTTKPFLLRKKGFRLSGWQDSNLRPPHPKCGAIPGYATPRMVWGKYRKNIVTTSLGAHILKTKTYLTIYLIIKALQLQLN
jgi:hypothetical protein